MSLYILDGNTLTELEDRTKPYYQTVLRRLASLEAEDQVALSVVSAYEFQYGIAKAEGALRQALQDTWATFAAAFLILPLDPEASGLYGELRARYERQTGSSQRASGRHTADFLIASTALHARAILVSSDKIFDRLGSLMPALQVEDWRLG